MGMPAAFEKWTVDLLDALPESSERFELIGRAGLGCLRRGGDHGFRGAGFPMHPRAQHPGHSRRERLPVPLATHRLLAATVAAAIAWWLRTASVSDGSAPYGAVLVAYVMGAATYLALTWLVLAPATGSALARHSAANDPGRAAVFLIVLASSATVVGGAFAVLRSVPHHDGDRATLLWLTLAALVLAWTVTHTVYALHYAHVHYQGVASGDADASTPANATKEGFLFPGREAPDGLDFIYLGFTIGMTFQVSDVQVLTRRCRRAVLRHALLAFIYNTLLIAFVINLLFGELQRGR